MQGIKYLVEGEHLPRHLAAIVQCYSHFVIDLDTYEFEIIDVSYRHRSLPDFAMLLISYCGQQKLELGKESGLTYHLPLFVRHSGRYWSPRRQQSFQKLNSVEQV